MRWARRSAWQPILLGAAVCSLLAASSCRPELRIRMSTRVFHDGSLERRLEVLGREAGGETQSSGQLSAFSGPSQTPSPQRFPDPAAGA